METYSNPYNTPRYSVAAAAAVDERASFITKTYLHLVGAIGALVLLETILLQLPITNRIVGAMTGGGMSWLIVLGAFMGVSWIAQSWARSDTSPSKQYLGLGLYVVAQAIILLPMLSYARMMDRVTESPMFSGVIATAGIATLGLFAVLTTIVFVTRKDFSFMRSILWFGGFAAMGLIVCAILFNFSLGPIFTYAMIAFACGHILYDTSNVLHHYRVGQHVAASLSLFASVALLFWYVLRIVMSSRD